MKAVVDGQPVQVYFTYGESMLSLIEQGPVNVRSVECVIRPFPATKDEDPEPLSTGFAQCSPLDNFVRSKGRFLAWKRAVGNKEDSRFTREQRQQLWQWFTSTCRLPSETNF